MARTAAGGDSKASVVIARPAMRQGMGALDAAHFIGISETYFRQLVSQGRMPKPRVIGQRRLWDIDELTASFKALPIEGEIEARDTTWDDWAPKS